MKNIKKLLSVILIAALLFQMLPSFAFAEKDTPGNIITDETLEETVNTVQDESLISEQASAYVVNELPELRTETQKHYRMSDGSFIAVEYNEPVHYQTSDDTWKAFDNTLRQVKGDGGVEFYESVNGESVRKFSSVANDANALVSVSDKEYTIEFLSIINMDKGVDQPKNAAVAVVSNDMGDFSALPLEEQRTRSLSEQTDLKCMMSTVTYDGIWNNTSVEYILHGYDVKENIIVEEPGETYEYTFVLSMCNLFPKKTSDGTIYFNDADGNTIYVMPAPYMYDANGEYSDGVTYRLEKQKNEYVFTVSADADWINKQGRAFPVTIDPTLYKQSGGIRMTTVSQASGSSAWTGFTQGYCGAGSRNGEYRMYAYIPTENLPQIPLGGRITGASISLYKSGYVGTYDNVNIRAFEVNEGYSMTSTNLLSMTWNNQPAVLSSQTMLDAKTIKKTDANGWYEWSIAAAVDKWYQGSANNHGISLRANFWNSNIAYVIFHSHNGGNKPRLFVAYIDTKGVEDYHTYQTVNVGRAGTAYIGDFDQELTFVRTDVSIDSESMPFSLSHIYNSSYGHGYYDRNWVMTRDQMKMLAGMGWKLSAQETVVQALNANLATVYYIYSDSDGTEHYFSYDSTRGCYADEEGLGLTMSVSGDTYTIYDDKGNYKYFYLGYLLYAKDAVGNAIYYTYDDYAYNAGTSTWKPKAANSKLTGIYRVNKNCSAQKLVTINYDNDLISSIKDEVKNQTTTFSYEPVLYGRETRYALTTVTQPDGQIVSYQYDTSGDDKNYRMISATDQESGSGVEFSYRSDMDTIVHIYEVACFSKDESDNIVYSEKMHVYRNNLLQATYRYYGDDVIAEDGDDLVVSYYFDRIGRTVNSTIMDASYHNLGADSLQYTANNSNAKTNNRLLSTGTATMEAETMLKNGGFEEGTDSWSGIDSDGGNIVQSTLADNFYVVYAKSGIRMLRLPTQSNTTVSQSVTLEAGKTYTLSGYVYVSEHAILNSSDGSAVQLFFSRGTDGFYSEKLNYTTQQIGDGWLRIYVTYTPTTSGTYSVGVCSTFTAGSVLVDSLQLEKGAAPTSFNMVQDGSFEMNEAANSPWEFGTGKSIVDIGTNGNYESSHPGNAAELTANSAGQVRLAQNVYFESDTPISGRTFVLSGWGMAKSMEFPIKQTYTSTDRFFGLLAMIRYTDDTTEFTYIPFNQYCTDWQYTCGVIAPKHPEKAIQYIRVAAAYDYNANGAALFDCISLTEEPAQTYTYDSDGNLSTVNSQSATEEYTYTGADLTQYISPTAGKVDYTYDSYHNLTGISYDGMTANYSRNAQGLVTQSTVTAEGTTQQMTSSVVYTSDKNRIASSKDVAGSEITYEYDNGGRLYEQTDALAHTVSTRYVTNSNRIANTFMTGVASLGHNYENGQIKDVERGSYRMVSGNNTHQSQYYVMQYDYRGNAKQILVSSEPSQSVTNATSYVLVTNTYAYEQTPAANELPDMSNKLVRQDNSNGTYVTFAYDLFDRVVKECYYDSNNDLDYTKNYVYNGQGFLTEIFITEGNSTAVTDRYIMEYDSLGRLINSRQLNGDTLVQRTSQKYDDKNRLSKQAWSLGNATYNEEYTYNTPNDDGENGDGSLATVCLHESGALISKRDYGYDPFNRVQSIVAYNGNTPLFSRRYAYRTYAEQSTTKTTNQVEYLTYRTGEGGSGTVLFGNRYLYDALGNITTVYDTSNGSVVVGQYTYDNLNQLHTEMVGGITYTYTYDTAGNLLSVKTGDTVTASYTYGNATWKDLLTAYNEHKIAYEGQTISRGIVRGTVKTGNPINWWHNDTEYKNLTWENGRRLVSLKNGTSTYSYSYDMDGIRKSKTVEAITHNYITQNGKVIQESYGTTVLQFIYDTAGAPYALRYSADSGSNFTTYYYVLNLQGDVVGLLDDSGALIVKYDYDAWGRVLSITNASGNNITSATHIANINPLRYRGYYYDEETGFYYLQSRYYDPIVKRFINADTFASTGQGFLGYNMFAYCGNNPVIAADPSGERMVQNVNLMVADTGLYYYVPQPTKDTEHKSVSSYQKQQICQAISQRNGYGGDVLKGARFIDGYQIEEYKLSQGGAVLRTVLGHFSSEIKTAVIGKILLKNVAHSNWIVAVISLGKCVYDAWLSKDRLEAGTYNQYRINVSGVTYQTVCGVNVPYGFEYTATVIEKPIGTSTHYIVDEESYTSWRIFS